LQFKAVRCDILDSVPALAPALNPAAIVLEFHDQSECPIWMRSFRDELTTIIVSDPLNSKMVMNSIGCDAYDWLIKPVRGTLLEMALRRALERWDLLQLKKSRDCSPAEELEGKASEIAQSKDFLYGILNSSSRVSVIVTDLDQIVRFWNKGAEHIFGYTAVEMLGRKITDIYPEDPSSKGIVQELQHMVKTGTGAVHSRMQQVAKDGRNLTMSLSISPLLNPSGELQGIIGIGQDVTEEARLTEELIRSVELIRKTQDVSIFTLAKLTEIRDGETGMHLCRIQYYCRALSTLLAQKEEFRRLMYPNFIEDLTRSCVLHDIGKVAIPDTILLSNDIFNEDQRTQMQDHVKLGGKALDDAVKELGEGGFLSMGRDVAYFHHENWDGSGYPVGLKEEEIPLPARIVAVADVYDALTSRRRYRDPMSHEQACEIIMSEKGKKFDPKIVDAFLEIEDDFRRIKDELCAES
jgi:PAS domain S-box-containing protein